MGNAASLLRAHPARARGTEPDRALTALRGLAAWWVVAYHFREALPPPLRAAAAPGYLAVDLFFVLSGYVIALNYGSWFTGGSFSASRILRFLWLRLTRIYPLHAVILVLFLSVPLALYIHRGGTAPGDLHVRYYLLSFVLMQNWGVVSGLTWNVPAWSISTEWLAYLLFPALAAAAFRIGATTAGAAGGLASMAVALGGVSAAIDPAGFTSDIQLAGVARCLFEFSIGIFVFLLREGREGTARLSSFVLLAGLAGAALGGAIRMPDYAWAPSCFAALVYALADERTALARALHGRALQTLGVISYSTYMVHFLLKDWTKLLLVRPGIPASLPFPAYAGAVLAASFLLFHVVERPAQRRLRRFSRARP